MMIGLRANLGATDASGRTVLQLATAESSQKRYQLEGSLLLLNMAVNGMLMLDLGTGDDVLDDQPLAWGWAAHRIRENDDRELRRADRREVRREARAARIEAREAARAAAPPRWAPLAGGRAQVGLVGTGFRPMDDDGVDNDEPPEGADRDERVRAWRASSISSTHGLDLEVDSAALADIVRPELLEPELGV